MLYLHIHKNAINAECGDHKCTSLDEFQKICNTKSNYWQNAGYFVIDINGIKTPNRFGRDIFTFMIGNDGILHPYGGIDSAIFSSCTMMHTSDFEKSEYYWKNNIKNHGYYMSYGYDAAGRIIEEGWKMNY